ncbi:electron transfer flavoprotein subunit alpha [Gottschalkiaceae bacterium SANA]|nr:electron transfer flavoprotein subunit alpha [Gottschalkiaceae bacterium SANA]
MTIGVVGEMRDGKLTQETMESICRAVQVNKDLQMEIDLVLMEQPEKLRSPWLDHWGVDHVIAYESKQSDWDIETKLAALEVYVHEAKPMALFFAGSIQGQELAPRLATRSKASVLVDCTAVEVNPIEQEFLVTKPIYGGNAYGEYHVPFPCYLSFRAKSIAVEVEKEAPLSIQWRTFDETNRKNVIVSRRLIRAAKYDLEEKKVLFVCGRGLQKSENIKRVEALACRVGAGLAGTKKAIENGWLPLETMIGQTGKILAPELCIVLGVSGASPFVHGIKGAKKIMAVNKDEEARIFQVSDIGSADDCELVIEVMERKFD